MGTWIKEHKLLSVIIAAAIIYLIYWLATRNKVNKEISNQPINSISDSDLKSGLITKYGLTDAEASATVKSFRCLTSDNSLIGQGVLADSLSTLYSSPAQVASLSVTCGLTFDEQNSLNSAMTKFNKK